MSKIKSRLPDLGLLVLRVGSGLMLALLHGWGKITGAFGYLFQGKEWGFPEAVGGLGFPLPVVFAIAAALSEFVGGLMLAAGLYTRIVSLPILFTMLVAVYRHLTTDMRFELAAVYAVIAIAFACINPGKFSIDSRLR